MEDTVGAGIGLGEGENARCVDLVFILSNNISCNNSQSLQCLEHTQKVCEMIYVSMMIL